MVSWKPASAWSWCHLHCRSLSWPGLRVWPVATVEDWRLRDCWCCHSRIYPRAAASWTDLQLCIEMLDLEKYLILTIDRCLCFANSSYPRLLLAEVSLWCLQWRGRYHPHLDKSAWICLLSSRVWSQPDNQTWKPITVVECLSWTHLLTRPSPQSSLKAL